MINIPHPEYPRPQLVRADWLNLNGPWEFEFDDDDTGLLGGWSEPSHRLHREIRVPFPFEAPASGIGDPGIHKVVWYRRGFMVPEDWQGRRVRLHFGAVDYEATVWVNGKLIGSHRGGYVAFWFDITAALQPGLNVVTVRVFDDVTPDQPRGKQCLADKSHGIWYTRCTGIWRTVWLEPVSDCCIEDWQVTPDFARSEIEIAVRVKHYRTLTLLAEVRHGNQPPVSGQAEVSGGRARLRLHIEPLHLWTPSSPLLYDLSLAVAQGEQVLDEVEAYFGLRDVAVRDGFITLNGQPVCQKLVLDQSYWPDGVYTAPSDEAIRGEVEWTLRLGFNGVRKHQVSSDPRFLYWADRLGLLIWQDMPGQNITERQAEYRRGVGQAEANYFREWAEMMREMRNHPSIIAWVPFNETWGIYGISKDHATQAFQREAVRLTRDLDPTRLVIDNDGWEHCDETDIFALHDYTNTGPELLKNLETWGRSETVFATGHVRALIPGARYFGTPLVLSEYGGLGMLPPDSEAPGNRWGYGSLEPDAASFLARYRGLQEALIASPQVAGYCYTQLTDVEQEINGLLSFHRHPKVDPVALRALNDMVQGPVLGAAVPQVGPKTPVKG